MDETTKLILILVICSSLPIALIGYLFEKIFFEPWKKDLAEREIKYQERKRKFRSME